MVMLISPEFDLTAYNIITAILPSAFESFPESEECVGYLEYRPERLGNSIATLLSMMMNGGPGVGVRHAWVWRHPSSNKLVVRTCDDDEMVPSPYRKEVYDFLPGTRDYHFPEHDYVGVLDCALTWLLKYQRPALPDFIVEFRNFFRSEEEVHAYAAICRQPVGAPYLQQPFGPDLIGIPDKD